MAFAKILVPVTSAADDYDALATGFAVAQPFNAHLAALFVHPDPRSVTASVYSGATVSPALIEDLVGVQTKLAREAEAAAHAMLRAVAKDLGASETPQPVRSDRTTCSFRARFGYIPQLVADEARYADLIVFKSSVHSELLSAMLETLMRAAKPIIVAAGRPSNNFARKIAVGWDGRDAAIHAATAALPFLLRAEEIDIFTVQPHRGRKIKTAEPLREYLGLHGVKATLREVMQNDESIGARLADAAAKAGSDLLVLGGYGHSHLRETFLCGVTIDVVSSHTLPVFLMH